MAQGPEGHWGLLGFLLPGLRMPLITVHVFSSPTSFLVSSQVPKGQAAAVPGMPSPCFHPCLGLLFPKIHFLQHTMSVLGRRSGVG